MALQFQLSCLDHVVAQQFADNLGTAPQYLLELLRAIRSAWIKQDDADRAIFSAIIAAAYNAMAAIDTPLAVVNRNGWIAHHPETTYQVGFGMQWLVIIVDSSLKSAS